GRYFIAKDGMYAGNAGAFACPCSHKKITIFKGPLKAMFTAKVVGLTGGIGSGKSTVAALFSELGIEWIDLDDIARLVVAPGEPALARIAEYFGTSIADIITEQGELNRAALRARIFEYPAEKAWLEALLHPLIQARTAQQVGAFNSPYGLLVSPLLFEKNTPVYKSIAIDIDEATQIARACERDNNTPEQIQRIMATQLSRHERNRKADYVIDNSGTIEYTQQQVHAIHHMLMANL
ncbi:MAG TPA: dephospho-CoA kinase, partial [Marinagarivorans sp.]